MHDNCQLKTILVSFILIYWSLQTLKNNRFLLKLVRTNLNYRELQITGLWVRVALWARIYHSVFCRFRRAPGRSTGPIQLKSSMTYIGGILLRTGFKQMTYWQMKIQLLREVSNWMIADSSSVSDQDSSY